MVTLAAPSSPAAHARRVRWWRFLERSHAHEVIAEWHETEGVLRLRETSGLAPEARLEETLPVAASWEAQVALWQLATRLHSMGAYWEQRSTDGRWRALAPPAGAQPPDLRANAVIAAPIAPLLHHFHDELGEGDTLLAAVAQQGPPGAQAGGPAAARSRGRFAVVRARLDVPSLDVGDIDLLSPTLPEPLARSLVLREQMGLARAGQRKLVTRSDYERAFGAGAAERAQRLVDEIVGRVRDGRLSRTLRPVDVEKEYAEFLVMLHDPRLRALHQRFLAPGEEERLLAQGPHAIGKAIVAKRASADHGVQHLLTLLEASLMAREKVRNGTLAKGDPEVRALTRLAYYL